MAALYQSLEKLMAVPLWRMPWIIVRNLLGVLPIVASTKLGCWVLAGVSTVAIGLVVDRTVPCTPGFMYVGCDSVPPEVEQRIVAIEGSEELTDRVALAMLEPADRDLYAATLGDAPCPGLREIVGNALRRTAMARQTSDWLVESLTSRVPAPLPSAGNDLVDLAEEEGFRAATSELVEALVENPDELQVNVFTALSEETPIKANVMLCSGDA